MRGRRAGAAGARPLEMAVPAPSVKCPRCGQMVAVPRTGEKVRCTGCGQKFRFEVPKPPAPPPLPVEPGTSQEELDRADTPPPAGAADTDEAPTPPPEAPPGAASEVRCARCGGTVQVPLSGEKVRCPGCGQKFRFEVPKPPQPPPPGEALPGIAPPDDVLAAVEAPAPPPEPTADDAAELRTLWPAVRRLIHHAYESRQVTDEERLDFRAKADRVAALATAFVGTPGPESAPGHVFVTSVLSELTLDELLHVSLEDYRHLDEALDEAERLLEERLPKAQPPQREPGPAERAPAAPAPVPLAPPAKRRRRELTVAEAVGAVVSVAALAAVVVFFPEIRDWAYRLQGADTTATRPERRLEPTSAVVIAPFPEPPKARTSARPSRPTQKRPGSATAPKADTSLPAAKVPEFVRPEPAPKVATAVAVPPGKTEPPAVPRKVEPPVPAPPEKAEPPAPESPWARLGAGVHRLFNGRDLADWTLSGAWAVRKGEIMSRAPKGQVALAVAGNPKWRDYTLRARCRIARADRMTREGEYYLLVLRYQDEGNFYCVRVPIEGIYEIGYYRNGAFREVGRARHGLGSRFNRWHDIEVAIHGGRIAVVIDDIRTGAPPWTIRGFERGAVGIGVTGGRAEFKDVRIRVAR